MVIRPVDGFKAIHRRRVRQSKQMSLATNTRASRSPSQSKCCQKPRAASAKCRVFPVYLIIFSPKRKDISSVSLQFSHQLFSINPSQKSWNKEKESSFSVTITVFLWIRAKEPYQKERDYQKGRNQADKKFHTQGGERTSNIALTNISQREDVGKRFRVVRCLS